MRGERLLVHGPRRTTEMHPTTNPTGKRSRSSSSAATSVSGTTIVHTTTGSSSSGRRSETFRDSSLNATSHEQHCGDDRGNDDPFMDEDEVSSSAPSVLSSSVSYSSYHDSNKMLGGERVAPPQRVQLQGQLRRFHAMHTHQGVRECRWDGQTLPYCPSTQASHDGPMLVFWLPPERHTYYEPVHEESVECHKAENAIDEEYGKGEAVSDNHNHQSPSSVLVEVDDVIRVCVPNHRGEYANLKRGTRYYEEPVLVTVLEEMSPYPPPTRDVATQVHWHELPVPPASSSSPPGVMNREEVGDRGIHDHGLNRFLAPTSTATAAAAAATTTE